MERIELREHDWTVTTDTVMGGLSTLTVVSENDGVRLLGSLSHENNGGFVSARIHDDSVACPVGAMGIRVYWRGDARRYRFILHEKGRKIREYFECELTQQTATLLWSDFTYRYRTVNDVERQFNPRKLCSMGILLRDTQTGDVEFSLKRLDWVLS